MIKKIFNRVIRQKSPLDDYRFHFDNVSKAGIAGWAHKKDDINHTSTIEICCNNVVLYSIKASLSRQDLRDAAIGTGLYGFDIPISELALSEDIDTIDIIIDGFKANQKPLPLEATASKNISASKNNIQMHLDGISVDKVFGWAKKKDSVVHRARVELKVGDILLGSDTADQFRQSIKDEDIGDGCYCFEITPKIHLFPSADIRCDLYIDGTKISTKPINFSVDEKTLEHEKFKHEFASEITDFGASVREELARLSLEVNEKDSNTMHVVMENIALLSVRIGVIEQVLTKHFADK